MKDKTILYYFFPALIAFFIAAALVLDGFSALSGFFDIQLQPARLINDFINTSGKGAALLNSASVGLVGFILISVTKTTLSGPTFTAIFTMMGFAFFGKTPLNIIPIIAGVYLSARFAGKSFKEYIIIALFGTALGPLVSTLAFELGFTGVLAVPAGIAGGLVAGFLLPALAVSMLHLHQGYNLYNMGLTCGFLSIFAAALIKAGGGVLDGRPYWYSEPSIFLSLLVPVLSIVLIILAFVSKGRKSLKDFIKIQRQSGRLPSDFIDIASLGGTFLNSGLIGLISSAYIFFSGGDFSGPVIGGMMTIMGFAAFGTHLKNSWSVVAGVIIAAFVFGKPLNMFGVQLAVLFCTTLAPLAGQFGWPIGLLAGFIHLVMVLQTGSWQGGINLYNNGFAGGLTATLIVAFEQWYRSNKKDEGFK